MQKINKLFLFFFFFFLLAILGLELRAAHLLLGLLGR
jgi:hypothetical protein